ncbi:MAG: ATP-binding cassette domain-containing protein [Alphaproteobacteria bacterium]|nr:ATP-binding cassette domain-containing protein [Alphaproteobacteria bacterium]
MSAPHLQFSGLTIGKNGKSLLGPIDLDLTSSGITVIMGPNGAGKSLFLFAAHGLLDFSSGSVSWGGQPARKTRASRGFVFQSTPILRRSVAGNIALALHSSTLRRAERSERIANALTEARLGTDPRKPAAALSGGERKRLDLARAIVTDPRILLLDEPAANLDPASTKELEEILRRIAQNGTKILMSTHDIAQARRLADDILFFDNGQLVEQAGADDFFDAAKSIPAQKFLKGEL